jgi:hypothetical protein
MDDRYGSDVLAGFSRRSRPAPAPDFEAVRDAVIEVTDSGFVGAVLGVENNVVRLEDRHGRVRVFPLGAGYLVDGKAVTLVAPRRTPRGPARTASGSFAAPLERARVAQPSRILVEGRHDAELVEKVWGHDLRVEGVVVERLDGVDDLAAVVADFRPSAERRLGVLVDHLVPGSKETAIADAVRRGPYGRHVTVVGHPYIDIWEAVKPERVGIRAWPVIPRGIEWKHGICEALGWPHEDQADIARAWQRILGTVRSFADLEPELLGRVEELIDFVTVPPTRD